MDLMTPLSLLHLDLAKSLRNRRKNGCRYYFCIIFRNSFLGYLHDRLHITFKGGKREPRKGPVKIFKNKYSQKGRVVGVVAHGADERLMKRSASDDGTSNAS